MTTRTRFRLARLADRLLSTFIVLEALAAPAMCFAALTARHTLGGIAAVCALAGICIGMLGVWAESKTYHRK